MGHLPPKLEISFPKRAYKTRGDLFVHGCHICGFRSEVLTSNGIEQSHIFPDGTLTNQPWNIIPLCPRCHQAFESIILPRIYRALRIAKDGFYPQPDQDAEGQELSSPLGSSMDEIVTQLISEDNRKQWKLDEL